MKFLSTNGLEFEVKHQDRGYGGRETTVFKVDGTTGALKGRSGNAIFTGMLPYSAVAVGADNTSSKGYATVSTAKAGDYLIAACNLTDASDGQAKFEKIVTVDGQIQQSSGTDNYSAKTFLFILQRP
jgi:hypothetical protein